MLNEIKFALTIALFLTERKRLQDRENRTSIMVCIHRAQVPEKVDFIEKRHFQSVVALKKNTKNSYISGSSFNYFYWELKSHPESLEDFQLGILLISGASQMA